jgi:hypothetical protein
VCKKRVKKDGRERQREGTQRERGMEEGGTREGRGRRERMEEGAKETRE